MHIYIYIHIRLSSHLLNNHAVTPNPPLHVRVTPQQNQSCQFNWTSPLESIGGIGGYTVSYGDNCNGCTPEAGFLNQTENLTAQCIECLEENSNMCYFEVNTVSEDCWFDSPPVEATSGEFYSYTKLHVRHLHADLAINSPANSMVSITCSLQPNHLIYVKWIVRLIHCFIRSKLMSRRSALLCMRYSFLETLLAQRRYDRCGAALSIRSNNYPPMSNYVTAACVWSQIVYY